MMPRARISAVPIPIFTNQLYAAFVTCAMIRRHYAGTAFDAQAYATLHQILRRVRRNRVIPENCTSSQMVSGGCLLHTIIQVHRQPWETFFERLDLFDPAIFPLNFGGALGGARGDSRHELDEFVAALEESVDATPPGSNLSAQADLGERIKPHVTEGELLSLPSPLDELPPEPLLPHGIHGIW
jgi:hypothetical protein